LGGEVAEPAHGPAIIWPSPAAGTTWPVDSDSGCCSGIDMTAPPWYRGPARPRSTRWVWQPVRSPARGRAPCAPSDPAGLPGVAQLASSGDTDPQGAADGLRAARVDRLLGLRVYSALLDRLDQLGVGV